MYATELDRRQQRLYPKSPGLLVLGNAGLDVGLTNITSGTLYPYVLNPRSYPPSADQRKLDTGAAQKVPVIRNYSTLSALNWKRPTHCLFYLPAYPDF